MMPSLIKVECFGGPADGDKRLPQPAMWFESVDPDYAHQYVRTAAGMTYMGMVSRDAAQRVMPIRPGTER